MHKEPALEQIDQHVRELDDQKVNVIMRKRQTKADLAQCLHATCLSPPMPTFTVAIQNNNFISWPGLTEKLINKHLPKSSCTCLGHLKSEKKGLQSTESTIALSQSEDYFPTPPSPNKKSKEVCYALDEATDIAGCMDLAGRFSKTSSSVNQHILVGYDYDGNYAHAAPIKNSPSHAITQAWEDMRRLFEKAGEAPTAYVLDNEISQDLINAFKLENADYQLVAPCKHRNNIAERVTQTYKSHFKSGLAAMDPNRPLAEWDCLIPQTNIALNLLRASRTNPKLSAHACAHGNFNFQATPIAPPGTKVIVHANPTKRASWDLNGQTGWCTGPSMKHYRCTQCYVPKTRLLVDADAVEFFPHSIPFSSFTLQYFLVQAATGITSMLANPPKSAAPTLEAGDPIKNAILNIAKLLKRADRIPQLPAMQDAKLLRVQGITDTSKTPDQIIQPSRVQENISTAAPMSKSATSNIIDYNPEEIAPKSTASKPKNIRY